MSKRLFAGTASGHVAIFEETWRNRVRALSDAETMLLLPNLKLDGIVGDVGKPRTVQWAAIPESRPSGRVGDHDPFDSDFEDEESPTVDAFVGTLDVIGVTENWPTVWRPQALVRIHLVKVDLWPVPVDIDAKKSEWEAHIEVGTVRHMDWASGWIGDSINWIEGGDGQEIDAVCAFLDSDPRIVEIANHLLTRQNNENA